MSINEVSLGSVGTAAMAYVAHITNHPSLCGFFLKVGVVGAILSIIIGVIVSMIKAASGEKQR